MTADQDQSGLKGGLKLTLVLLEELKERTLYGVVTAADFIMIIGHFQHFILSLSTRDLLNVLSGLAGFLLFRL